MCSDQVRRAAVAVGGGRTRLAGRDALHRGVARPEGLEPHPKRRVGDGTVLLGSTDEVPVSDLIAVVLGRVRAGAGPVDELVHTGPASWGRGGWASWSRRPGRCPAGRAG